MALPTSPNARLLTDRYRIPIERAVSAHFGAPWQVQSFSDMRDNASHPAAILTDAGGRGVFVKLSEAAHGLDQFEAELAGLRTLAERAGVLIPPPVGIVLVEGGVMLVLEALEPVERTPEAWREIGRTLARIHRVKGEQYGYAENCYFGPLYQDNRPAADWLTFFTERRLWPRLTGAVDSGNLSTELLHKVERLIARLPGLGIPEVEPALLHGDAQVNNFLCTRQGAVVVGPSVYYGPPEVDLAHVDFFQPVPDDLFDGYREILPIAPDFAERKALWRIPAYLGVIQVGWLEPMPQLVEAVEMFL
jgi:protein-ribulosamine 3-kinase